ncbi:ankyrin-2-like [Penaeus indicus]|uniref:ankyrin-2-like n=1 Tax=Penaeus indicus TaxID=29960 RepID=UPI00300D11E9
MPVEHDTSHQNGQEDTGGGGNVSTEAPPQQPQQAPEPIATTIVNGTHPKVPSAADDQGRQESPKDPKKTDGSASFLRAARAGNLEKVLEFLKTNTDINTCNANGLNALHLASKEGHVSVVTELLQRGANVDAATKKGNTALHIASLAGQEEIVKVLVQHQAMVNIQSQNGFTPLYMAAQENHDNVVRFLLANNANQSLATEDGFTPLAVALQQGHDKVVAVLLENDTRGKVRLPALHIAAKKDDTKAAALLLHTDHNPDVTSKSGFTPLHIAAHYGNENIANLLIQRGADVNYVAKHQITPLHVASKWGKGNMVSLLIDKGANYEAKTRDGLTPLHCAARSGHDTVVDMLLEKGAPITSKTKNGLAPLHMASQGDHVDAARILLYHKAPVDDVTVDFLTALHVAAHCGHVRVAKLLLDRKADPNARALNGFTPLHIACKKNRIKVVELLLKHGASIEATTESGLTPLHVASFMGCMNIVIYLIQHGASADVPTVRGETPLHLAARANQTDIIRILLRNGAQVDARAREQQTALHIASRLGNSDIVVLLLQHGAAVDATTKDHYTALHIAAKEGQEEVASVLLEHGASLTSTTKKGFTPLHLAAKYGNMKVARLLLQKDAPVDAQGKNGVTPLHVAAHYDHQNVALLLLDKGASPHATAKNGYTPLHIAARKNQMDIATTLLEYGASANAESKAGFTPLHLSSQEGHTDMATLLIEHNAAPGACAKNGLTPLHLCAQEDRVNVAAILVKHGAQIDPATKAGYTPLHVACHFGQMNMVRFLLQHGAKVESSTQLGYTPLHQAAQQGHTQIVNLLLENKAEPNAETKDGKTALSIAQRLGYISVVETLKIVTETTITTTTTTVTEEKYKVVVPETMHETFMSESEDEGGDDNLVSSMFGKQQHVTLPFYEGQLRYTSDDTMLGDQSYRYLTADEMKSLGDDSLPIDVTKDEKMDVSFISNTMAAPPVAPVDQLSPQHQKEQQYAQYTGHYPSDNVDIAKTPILAGPESLNTTLNTTIDSAMIESQIIPTQVANQLSAQVNQTQVQQPVGQSAKGQVPADQDSVPEKAAEILSGWEGVSLNSLASCLSAGTNTSGMWRDRFLVSFMVDARGGAMRGCRHSGVRVIIPPRKAAMPMRITCRYLKKDKLVHAPPLMEGEALGSRILEMGPAGAKFLGPVIIEVPHFASLRGKEREIVILRSDNGETWREHTLEATEEAVQEVLNESFDGEELKQLEDLNTNRITRILTTDFPQYFAIVTRIRQEVHAIGPEGGMVSSTVVPQVQAVFPQGALTKKIKVGLQVNLFKPRKNHTGPMKKISVNNIPKKKRFSLIWIKKTLDGKLHKELLIKEGKQMTQIERKMSQVMYREEPMTDVNPRIPNAMRPVTSGLRISFSKVHSPSYGCKVKPYCNSLSAKASGISGWSVHCTDADDSEARSEAQNTKLTLAERSWLGVASTFLYIWDYEVFDILQMVFFYIVPRIFWSSVRYRGILSLVEDRDSPYFKQFKKEWNAPKSLTTCTITTVDTTTTTITITSTFPTINTSTVPLQEAFTGGTTRAQWEDVTGSTPLTFVNDCVSFTTTVSARFWLMDCSNIPEATKMATELYREAIHVPFMAKFVVFSKRHQLEEARVRVFCMTDDREDKTLEQQELFVEVAKSRDVEVLEGKPQYLEFAGNLVPVTKSGDQLAFNFYAFRENRLPFTVRVKDQHADPIGRVAFMRQPKVGVNCVFPLIKMCSHQVAKSRDVEVLEGKPQYLEFAGNLVPVTKSGDQLAFNFYAFRENRLPFTVRVKDQHADPIGRVAFMRQPKDGRWKKASLMSLLKPPVFQVGRGDPPQTPICNLNIALPDNIQPEPAPSEPDLLALEKKYSFLSISKADTIHKADLRLTDISNMLGTDWVGLARELEISDSDINIIKSQYPDNAPKQAIVMLRLWMQTSGNKANGNTLEKGLRKIGRDDIVNQCIFNVELVTDDIERAMAKAHLDQSGFDAFRYELGPSRDTTLNRDVSLDVSYDEQDMMKEAESAEEEEENQRSYQDKTRREQHTADMSPTYESEEKKYAGEEKIVTEEKITKEEMKDGSAVTVTTTTTSVVAEPVTESKKEAKDKTIITEKVVQEDQKAPPAKEAEKVEDKVPKPEKKEEKPIVVDKAEEKVVDKVEEVVVEQKVEEKPEVKVVEKSAEVGEKAKDASEKLEEKAPEVPPASLDEAQKAGTTTATEVITGPDGTTTSSTTTTTERRSFTTADDGTVKEHIVIEKKTTSFVDGMEKGEDKSEILLKLGEELGRLDEQLEERFKEKRKAVEPEVAQEEVRETTVVAKRREGQAEPTSQVVVEHSHQPTTLSATITSTTTTTSITPTPDGFTQASVESRQMSSTGGTTEVSTKGTAITTTQPVIGDETVMQMGQALIQQRTSRPDSRRAAQDVLQWDTPLEDSAYKKRLEDGKERVLSDDSTKAGHTEERGCSPITVLEARPEVDHVATRPRSRAGSHTITTTTSWGAPVTTTTSIEVDDDQSARCLQLTLHSESRVTLHAPGGVWEGLHGVEQQPEHQDEEQQPHEDKHVGDNDVPAEASPDAGPVHKSEGETLTEQDSDGNIHQAKDAHELESKVQIKKSEFSLSQGADAIVSSSVGELNSTEAPTYDLIAKEKITENIVLDSSKINEDIQLPSSTGAPDVQVDLSMDEVQMPILSSIKDSIPEGSVPETGSVPSSSKISVSAEEIDIAHEDNALSAESVSSDKELRDSATVEIANKVMAESAQDVLEIASQPLSDEDLESVSPSYDIKETECAIPVVSGDDSASLVSEATAPSAHRPTTLMITSNSNESTDDAECTANDLTKLGREDDIPKELKEETSVTEVENLEELGMGELAVSERPPGSESGAVPRPERPARPAPRTTTLVKVKVEKRPITSHLLVRERSVHEHQPTVHVPSVEEEVRGLMQEVKEATSQIKQEVKELRQADTPTPDTPTPLREFKEFLNREEEQELERLPTIKEMCRESEEDASGTVGGTHEATQIAEHQTTTVSQEQDVGVVFTERKEYGGGVKPSAETTGGHSHISPSPVPHPSQSSSLTADQKKAPSTKPVSQEEGQRPPDDSTTPSRPTRRHERTFSQASNIYTGAIPTETKQEGKKGDKETIPEEVDGVSETIKPYSERKQFWESVTGQSFEAKGTQLIKTETESDTDTTGTDGTVVEQRVPDKKLSVGESSDSEAEYLAHREKPAFYENQAFIGTEKIDEPKEGERDGAVSPFEVRRRVESQDLPSPEDIAFKDVSSKRALFEKEIKRQSMEIEESQSWKRSSKEYDETVVISEESASSTLQKKEERKQTLEETVESEKDLSKIKKETREDIVSKTDVEKVESEQKKDKVSKKDDVSEITESSKLLKEKMQVKEKKSLSEVSIGDSKVVTQTDLLSEKKEKESTEKAGKVSMVDKKVVSQTDISKEKIEKEVLEKAEEVIHESRENEGGILSRTVSKSEEKAESLSEARETIQTRSTEDQDTSRDEITEEDMTRTEETSEEEADELMTKEKVTVNVTEETRQLGDTHETVVRETTTTRDGEQEQRIIKETKTQQTVMADGSTVKTTSITTFTTQLDTKETDEFPEKTKVKQEVFTKEMTDETSASIPEEKDAYKTMTAKEKSEAFVEQRMKSDIFSQELSSSAEDQSPEHKVITPKETGAPVSLQAKTAEHPLTSPIRVPEESVQEIVWEVSQERSETVLSETVEDIPSHQPIESHQVKEIPREEQKKPAKPQRKSSSSTEGRLSEEEARKLAIEIVEEVKMEAVKRSPIAPPAEEFGESEGAAKPPFPRPSPESAFTEETTTKIEKYIQEQLGDDVDEKQLKLIESVTARKTEMLHKKMIGSEYQHSMEITDEDLRSSGAELSPIEHQMERLRQMTEEDDTQRYAREPSEADESESSIIIHETADDVMSSEYDQANQMITKTLDALKTAELGKVERPIDTIKEVPETTVLTAVTETRDVAVAEKTDFAKLTKLEVQETARQLVKEVTEKAQESEAVRQASLTAAELRQGSGSREHSRTPSPKPGSRKGSWMDDEDLRREFRRDYEDKKKMFKEEMTSDKDVFEEGSAKESKEMKVSQQKSSDREVHMESSMTESMEESSTVESVRSIEGKIRAEVITSVVKEVKEVETEKKEEVVMRKKGHVEEFNRRSGTDFDAYSSSGESHYFTAAEGTSDSRTASRPCSSDVEALISERTTGTSEYDTALTSQDASQYSSYSTSSQDYRTAASSISSRDSMKSIDSESSGHLASFELSEASETLVPSAAELEKDMDLLDQDVAEEEISHSHHTVIPQLTIQSDTPKSEDAPGSFEVESDDAEFEQDGKDGDSYTTSKMKRSIEMTFYPEPKPLSTDKKGSVTESVASSLEESTVSEVSMATVVEQDKSMQGSTTTDSNMTASSVSEQMVSSVGQDFDHQVTCTDSGVLTTDTGDGDMTLHSVTITATSVPPSTDDQSTASMCTQVTSETRAQVELTESEQFFRANGPTEVDYVPEYDDEEVQGARPAVAPTVPAFQEAAGAIAGPSEGPQKVVIVEECYETEADQEYGQMMRESEYSELAEAELQYSLEEQPEAEMSSMLVIEEPIERPRTPEPGFIPSSRPTSMIIQSPEEPEEFTEVDKRFSAVFSTTYEERDEGSRSSVSDVMSVGVPDITVTEHTLPMPSQYCYPDLEREEDFPECRALAEAEDRGPDIPATPGSQESASTCASRKSSSTDSEQGREYCLDDMAHGPSFGSFEMVEADEIDDFSEYERTLYMHEERMMEMSQIKEEDEEEVEEERRLSSSPIPIPTQLKAVKIDNSNTPSESQASDETEDPDETGDPSIEEQRRWLELQFEESDVTNYEYQQTGFIEHVYSGPLEDIEEEREDAERRDLSHVTKNSSLSSTPEYDVLAGRKFFTRSGEHDDVSMTSLQEFENLEQQVAVEAIARRASSGSQESLNGKRPESKSGHGDDISVGSFASLQEFERLEKECLIVEQIEKKAQEEAAMLSEIEEGHESQMSESESCETLSEPGRASVEGEEYDQRLFEIDEIIRQAQDNVEKFDKSKAEYEGVRLQDIVSVDGSGSGSSHADRTPSVGREEGDADSLEEAQLPELDLDQTGVTSLGSSAKQDTMSMSADSIEAAPKHKVPRETSQDSLEKAEARSSDPMTTSVDSIEFVSRQDVMTTSTDSIEARRRRPDAMSASTDSIEPSRRDIMATSIDSLGRDDSSGRDADISSGSEQVRPLPRDGGVMECSLESLEPTSSQATHATYQYDTDSIMSGSFTSGCSNTLVASTDDFPDMMTSSMYIPEGELPPESEEQYIRYMQASGGTATEIVQPTSEEGYSHTVTRVVRLQPEAKQITFTGPDAQKKMEEYMQSFNAGEHTTQEEAVDAQGNVHIRRVTQKRIVTDPKETKEHGFSVADPSVEELETRDEHGNVTRIVKRTVVTTHTVEVDLDTGEPIVQPPPTTVSSTAASFSSRIPRPVTSPPLASRSPPPGPPPGSRGPREPVLPSLEPNTVSGVGVDEMSSVMESYTSDGSDPITTTHTTRIIRRTEVEDGEVREDVYEEY